MKTLRQVLLGATAFFVSLSVVAQSDEDQSRHPSTKEHAEVREELESVLSASATAATDFVEVVACRDSRTGSSLSLRVKTRDGKFDRAVLSFEENGLDSQNAKVLRQKVEGLALPLVENLRTLPFSPSPGNNVVIWHGAYEPGSETDQAIGNLFEFVLKRSESDEVDAATPYQVVVRDYGSKLKHPQSVIKGCSVKKEILAPITNSRRGESSEGSTRLLPLQ